MKFFTIFLFLLLPTLLFARTDIYRSVQPGNTSAIAIGAGNNLRVSNDTCYFASALPDTIGIGNLLQYDDDNDGDIDANDSILFFKKRVSPTAFLGQTTTGGTPTATAAADQDWSIFHPYTSWINMEAGTENTGIDADLRAFDAGNRNIGSANEDWYVAFYRGTETIGAVAVNFSGWDTGASRQIKFFSPVSSIEVGVSQRHSGVWTSACYQIIKTDVDNLGIFESASTLQNWWIDGLQFFVNITSNAGECYAMRFTNGTQTANIKVSNCILRGKYDATATIRRRSGINANNVDQQASVLKVWNNIIYNFWTAFDNNQVAGIRIPATNFNGKAYIYNNTLDSCRYAIVTTDGASYLKNNIVQRSQDGFNGDSIHVSSNYNITDTVSGNAPGANSKDSTTVTFVDATNKNFLLATNDTAAKNAGTNTVTSDISETATDILGISRPQGAAFDIGASEVLSSGRRGRVIIIGWQNRMLEWLGEIFEIKSAEAAWRK